MKDPYLLPFILPNVFEISKTLSKDEFTVVLPRLQPLFALKDPPQNMLSRCAGSAAADCSAPRAPLAFRREDDTGHIP
jgi:hypothetical protein